MAILLEGSHGKKAQDHQQPVEVVRDDGAVSGRVSPSEKRVEHAPSAVAAVAAVEQWVAAVDMPDTLTDVVGAWSRSDLSRINTGDLVPFIRLEVSYSLRE